MREMKDSGVVYIGYIPVTWNITRTPVYKFTDDFS